jgi:electron transfer flavoprotein alpha/beta subunit
MKILVMIKQVPDTATQMKIAGDGRAIDTAGITWIVSPYDEFAVEEALKIKEKRGEGEVVVVTLGSDRARRRSAPAWPWARTAPCICPIPPGTAPTLWRRRGRSPR